MIKSKRRWLGRRVWVADADGRRRLGTLWWEDETSVQIREDGVVGLRVIPRTAEGTRWWFADGAPATDGRLGGAATAQGTKRKREPMRRRLMRRLMCEWDRAGLLPEPLLVLLSALFPPAPPPEPVRLYLAAFAWWRRKTPDKAELMRLAALLRRLEFATPDRDWIAQTIRKADAFDAEVEAVLRA